MFLIQISYVVFFLYMWFDTDGFVEYSKAFGLEKRFKIDLWEKYREINPKMDYLGYIRIKHDGFFVRLIGCRQCLCFWAVLASCAAFSDFFYFPAIYMASYMIYRLICKSLK